MTMLPKMTIYMLVASCVLGCSTGKVYFTSQLPRKPGSPATGIWYPSSDYQHSPEFNKAVRVAQKHLKELGILGEKPLVDFEYKVRYLKSRGSKFDGGIRVFFWYIEGYDENGLGISGPSGHAAVMMTRDFETVEFGR